MDRILIDECLSTALVATAKARGHDATHVVWIGKGGLQDWTLMGVIAENDFLFVTNNRRHFMRLYAQQELHNGLIVILPSVERSVQVRLFSLALDEAERLDRIVNTLIEVHADDRIAVLEWSLSAHSHGHIDDIDTRN